MKVEIREARKTDLQMLLPLYGQLGMDNGDVLSLAEAQKKFRRMRAYPDYRLYCALYEGAVIGTFALLVMDNMGHMGKPSAVLEDVVVAGKWRGRGIGGQMVCYAMARSREKGCYKLSLSSNENREDAHRFYEKIGFKRHGYSYAMFLENEVNF
ncbi:MAG: GNAT family N-acetyltransferase [Pseudomonadota bacterium]